MPGKPLRPKADATARGYNSIVAEARCVYCREKPIDPRFRPFCSERCKLLDLGRWVDGNYRVPGDPVEEQRDDDEEPER